jgi:hypothetical protein
MDLTRRLRRAFDRVAPLQWLLIAGASVLAAVNYGLEYEGIWDRVSGRDLAVEGLRRLKSTAGYTPWHKLSGFDLFNAERLKSDVPECQIYPDTDRDVFAALENRISGNTTDPKVLAALRAGKRPDAIVTAGRPEEILGVADEFPPEAKLFYASEHPVGYVFGPQPPQVRITGIQIVGPSAYVHACTLAELDHWLAKERDDRRLLVGGLTIALVGIVLVTIRHGLALQAKPKPPRRTFRRFRSAEARATRARRRDASPHTRTPSRAIASSPIAR